MVISDPEIPFTTDEISNFSRYLNLGGIVVVFAENATENDLESINNLINIGGLEIYNQTKGETQVLLSNFGGVDYNLSLHYPMKIRNNTNDLSRISLINDYIALAHVGKGKIVVIGDEDIITEQYIDKLNNSEFISEFFQNVMNNSMDITVELSSDKLDWGEKTYISMSLNNKNYATLLKEDYLGILGFLNNLGESINANIFGFEIPVMPMLLTNSTATYSYFDSTWISNENNEISIVLYVDTPSTLSECFSFVVYIHSAPEPGEFIQFKPEASPYPFIIDFMFVLLLLSSLFAIWLYSMDRWKARHRFVEFDEENKNLIDNNMSSLQSEIEMLQSGILSEKIQGLEKIRFILKHEKELSRKLKELKKLAENLGEK